MKLTYSSSKLIKTACFLSVFCFFLSGISKFLIRPKEKLIKVLGTPYQTQRFDNFKGLSDHMTILQTITTNYSISEDSTLDFIGCCLERQILTKKLFETSNITHQIILSNIQNVFVTNKCDVYFNHVIYQFCRVYYESLMEIPYIPSNITYLDHVLHVYMTWPFSFGKFLFNTLSILSLYPSDILKKSKIILYEVNPYINESLSTFGISPDQYIVTTHAEEIFYAHNLYSIANHHCNHVNPVSFQKLREHFVRVYDLDKTPPKHFAMMTRLGKSNELMNYQDVLEVIKGNYSEIDWIIDQELNSVKETVLFYNSLKLLFTCTSSDIALSLLMQKATVVCEIHGAFFEPLFLHVSAYVGHHHIIARIPNMPNRKKKPYELPLETAINMIRQALEYLDENGE
ncbi:hypothetical protein TRFO_22688 [Tritrichomonas foetus]|uniref:Glycosyltransferase 61 catalytic domain-containing protein n=1 Tax=Tritrichomonas foetus TaxID=1144522 RepID=A0A1J4KCV1_9EUKA|nr:hypothetical protein TRFO_22688 [Tritrichomonas foetus]|eukprot:OHT08768.1 hypothetical protein TRFO_22688 [Tritrichomonas foetus]